MISIPPKLAERLDREASARNVSFSAVVVELLERADTSPSLPYVGTIDDDEDLSQRVEEILARLDP